MSCTNYSNCVNTFLFRYIDGDVLTPESIAEDWRVYAFVFFKHIIGLKYLLAVSMTNLYRKLAGYF